MRREGVPGFNMKKNLEGEKKIANISSLARLPAWLDETCQCDDMAHRLHSNVALSLSLSLYVYTMSTAVTSNPRWHVLCVCTIQIDARDKPECDCTQHSLG